MAVNLSRGHLHTNVTAAGPDVHRVAKLVDFLFYLVRYALTRLGGDNCAVLTNRIASGQPGIADGVGSGGCCGGEQHGDAA
jgi:hypothetical protein